MFQVNDFQLTSYIKRAGIALIPFILLVFANIFYPNQLQQIDKKILLSIYHSSGSYLTQFVKFYTTLANSTTVTISVIYLWMSFRYHLKQKRIAKWFLITLIVGIGILNPLMKYIIMRPRPTVVSHLIVQGGYSFPSGHSSGSMMLYGALALIFYEFFKDKAWARGVAAFILTFFPITIALSRLYLGVHYPSDTIAGLSLGLATVIVAAGYLHTVILKEPEF